MKSEFDGLSKTYEELLDDPIRNRFTGPRSDFFHRRKRDLIREYFGAQGIDSRKLSYLDLGCGKGELASLLSDDFARVTGCDPSAGMLEGAGAIEVRVQERPEVIPFDNDTFDFITAVCVYHHVPLEVRPKLSAEVRRVLKPGGRFCIIEHNPYNPVTRLIVSRTPVDADAILLKPSETADLMNEAGFSIEPPRFFLYLPQRLYSSMGFLESALVRLPLGGQYAVWGTRK